MVFDFEEDVCENPAEPERLYEALLWVKCKTFRLYNVSLVVPPLSLHRPYGVYVSVLWCSSGIEELHVEACQFHGVPVPEYHSTPLCGIIWQGRSSDKASCCLSVVATTFSDLR